MVPTYVYHFLRLIIFFSCMSLSAQAAINDASIKTKWGYKGNISPSRWAELDNQFAVCATGKYQSPINITGKVKNVTSPLTVDYHDVPINIIHDGITDLTIGPTQTVVFDGHSIQVNMGKTAPESITVAEQQYKLIQFHFHTPSENLWQGRSFPLEIHFVNQGDNGKVAVIAVFIKAGPKNNTLQKIIEHSPTDTGKAHLIADVKINPGELLPLKKDHYVFTGSLTTPPCTEGLQWLVMSQPITALPAQIQQLRKAIGGNNARPTQPLNDRKILFSAE